MKSIVKMTLRTIRSFLGRFLALMLIVALSVSFFAGLSAEKRPRAFLRPRLRLTTRARKWYNDKKENLR